VTHYTWIKLYIEILDDDKLGLLPDWLKWRMVQLFLVAREKNRDGLLGPVSGLAWRLRISEDDLIGALRTLSEIGIVAETPDGWLVVNFLKRQAPVTTAERVREYRKRERNDGETKRYKKCNESVTEAEIDSSSTSISNSPLEEGGMGGETENVFTAYEHNIGILTPMIADALKDGEATYGPVWVCAAIQEAVASNARSWKYCEAILARWSKEGFKSSKKVSSGKQSPEQRQATNLANIQKGVEMAFGGENNG
jgi:DnaD/phage-associated family protein